ncbi:hypothetical protein BGW80DRAFT_792123 [Lactifluus volemus]|nr:hypothetical protein BGW80DRAFT_792123 [Lactifluus volemus]
MFVADHHNPTTNHNPFPRLCSSTATNMRKSRNINPHPQDCHGQISARPEPRRKRRSKKPAAKYTPAAVHAPAVAIAVANRKHTSKRTRTKTTVKPHGSLLAFVYVGNLRADVQNADLERLFKPEDDQDEESRVTKIDIRCGFGNVVPSKCGTPVYATVVFRGVGGATKAMDKNGHTLLGKKIIVSPSFLDMPEAKEALRRKGRNKTFLGVNLGKIGGAVHQMVNRVYTGGTQATLVGVNDGDLV